MKLAIYIFTKRKKPNKNRYYSLIIKSTTEHCGLEVGYPPNGMPTLTCHLGTWRKDCEKDTAGSAREPALLPKG